MITDASPDSESTITIQFLIAEGDLVALWGRFTGTQKGTPDVEAPLRKVTSVNVSGVYRVEDGRIADIWGTTDNLESMRQLGHLPRPQGD